MVMVTQNLGGPCEDGSGWGIVEVHLVVIADPNLSLIVRQVWSLAVFCYNCTLDRQRGRFLLLLPPGDGYSISVSQVV